MPEVWYVFGDLVGDQAGGLAHPVGIGPEVRVGFAGLLLGAALLPGVEGERVGRLARRESDRPGRAGRLYAPQYVLLRPEPVADDQVRA